MLQLAAEMRVGAPMRDAARMARAREDAAFAAQLAAMRPN